MRRTIAAISILFLTASGSAGLAQDLSVEEMKANLQAQVRAKQDQQPISRGLKINNGTGDYVGELYPAPAGPNRPQPAPAPAPLSFKVEFALNSTELSLDSLRTISRLASALADPELADRVWIVVGHTDSSGSAARNLRLSKLRAEAVVSALGKLNAPAARLLPVGRGESELLPNVPPTSGANRRVEIKLLEE